jgi:DNA polymerase-4
MDRQIVCFQVPTIEIALARLREPALRSRPVAIAPLHASRTLLQEVSPEAERDGVMAGMPVEDARRVCPSLRLLPPDPARAYEAGRRLIEIIARFAPVWEPVRPGYLFLDLTGTTRLFGLAPDTAARIEREALYRCSLAGVAGVGSNKLVSRVAATLIPPLQLCDVRPGSEETFLAPLPVTVLPGFSRTRAREVLATLDDLNVFTLGEIAEIPLVHLEAVLGGEAVRLHDWAHGIDPSPVLPRAQQPKLETALVLESDEIDDTRLHGLLQGLLERLCRELRQQRRLCRRLALSLRYSDHVQVRGWQPVQPGSHWEVELFPLLTSLLARLFRRRVRVRALTVAAEALIPAEEQLFLFANDTDPAQRRLARARHLALALDRIRARFGERAIRRAAMVNGHSSIHLASPH